MNSKKKLEAWSWTAVEEFPVKAYCYSVLCRGFYFCHCLENEHRISNLFTEVALTVILSGAKLRGFEESVSPRTFISFHEIFLKFKTNKLLH